jgi:hypothetical protein
VSIDGTCDSCHAPFGDMRIKRTRPHGDDTVSEYTICMTCETLARLGLIFILEMPDGTIKAQKT